MTASRSNLHRRLIPFSCACSTLRRRLLPHLFGTPKVDARDVANADTSLVFLDKVRSLFLHFGFYQLWCQYLSGVGADHIVKIMTHNFLVIVISLSEIVLARCHLQALWVKTIPELLNRIQIITS